MGKNQPKKQKGFHPGSRFESQIHGSKNRGENASCKLLKLLEGPRGLLIWRWKPYFVAVFLNLSVLRRHFHPSELIFTRQQPSITGGEGRGHVSSD